MDDKKLLRIATILTIASSVLTIINVTAIIKERWALKQKVKEAVKA